MQAGPFDAVTDEKKRRILEAALSEFSKNGYDATGTRAITREAGVSAGLLFYYFKDKKELYYILCETLSDFLIRGYFEDGSDDGRKIMEDMDFFSRMCALVNKKIEYRLKYPDIFSLLFGAYKKFPEFPKRAQERIYSEYAWIYRTDSCFKDGVDNELARNVIETFLSSLADKYIDMICSEDIEMTAMFDEACAETYMYLEFFKKHFGK